LKKLGQTLDKIESTIIAVLLAAQLITVLSFTIARYTQLWRMPWGEEFSRYCMVWMIYIGIIVGARTSLIVGFFAAIIVLIIGGTIGALSGYLGGKFDLIVMRVVDVIYSLPDILIIILFSTTLAAVFDKDKESPLAQLGSGFVSIFLVFAILYWVGMCRLVRGQVLSIKKQEYVMAAKANGANTRRIILKHLLPNSISVIIISAALQIPSAIFTESFLSYLGLGVKYPTPSLGSLASESQSFITMPNSPKLFMFLIPAISICLIVLSLNLLGDGLRDAFDPKLQK
jgi:oligopeptide transport system permease protein